MDQYEFYEDPLAGRYASPEVRRLYGAAKKHGTWRWFWCELAQAEQALGAPITDDQLTEMREHVTLTAEEFAWAAADEKRIRHDVMAHVHAFAHTCPRAGPIIHLAATSCDPTDNTDLYLMREGLGLVKIKLARVVHQIMQFAWKWRNLPTLGFTHFQPAQPVTVGKRAAMWAQDFLMDLQAIEAIEASLPFRGVRGITGTEDSFLKLFDGDEAKVRELNRRVAAAFGFKKSLTITSQTYTRKLDTRVLTALAGIAESAHKFGSDMRLLQHMREVEEPHETEQVGSSAAAYKRNPMRAERICSLAQSAEGHLSAARPTHGNQWLERTLNDSAAKRMYVPKMFLTIDAILILLLNVTKGLVVYPAVIARHLREELPFMITEELIVEMVKAGADRQQCHEKVRDLALAAADRVKQGEDNDLIERFKADPYFAPVHGRLDAMMDASRFIGRAPSQVVEFNQEEVQPALAAYANVLEGGTEDLRV